MNIIVWAIFFYVVWYFYSKYRVLPQQEQHQLFAQTPAYTHLVAQHRQNVAALLPFQAGGYTQEQGGPGSLMPPPLCFLKEGMAPMAWSREMTQVLARGFLLTLYREECTQPDRLWVGQLPWLTIRIRPAHRSPEASRTPLLDPNSAIVYVDENLRIAGIETIPTMMMRN